MRWGWERFPWFKQPDGHTSYIITVITACNSSCGKVMFSQARVIPSVDMGEGSAWGVCIWGVCIGGSGRPPQSDNMGYGQRAGGTHPTGNPFLFGHMISSCSWLIMVTVVLSLPCSSVLPKILLFMNNDYHFVTLAISYWYPYHEHFTACLHIWRKTILLSISDCWCKTNLVNKNVFQSNANHLFAESMGYIKFEGI